MHEQEPIILVFPRAEIEPLNLAPFLRRYGTKVLPRGKALAGLMGRFNFIVHGYDDDPQEIYAIEPVRALYRKLWEEWPYWLFFCDLQTEGLMMMTVCCLTKFSAAKKAGEPETRVEVDPLELLRFVSKGFMPMNEMFERADQAEMAIYSRTKAVMEYFGFPFDEPPPMEASEDLF
jgi:hypothetical protein